MLRRVWEKCAQVVKPDNIIVATDDKRIENEAINLDMKATWLRAYINPRLCQQEQEPLLSSSVQQRVQRIVSGVALLTK